METKNVRSGSIVKKSSDDAPPEKRLVWAEVYAPNRPDAGGEFMTADSIEKMAYKFMKNMRLDQVDVQHDNETTDGVAIVESFIARPGDPDFIEGAWVVCVHVADDALWELVKAGEINGFSMEAMVLRDEREVEIEIPPVVTGRTTEEDGHTHMFYVAFDADAKFLGGSTDVVNGHQHRILRGTATEVAGDPPHTHRFSAVDNVEILTD